MKSSISNYRQSPRKVRLVAGLVKGKKINVALAELDMLGKRAALPIKKLILSAVANAKENNKVDADNLIVKDLRVDKGVVMKRFMPRAMGRAFRIKKRTSHIHVVLGEAAPAKNKAKTAEKKEEVKPKAKKTAVKKKTKK